MVCEGAKVRRCESAKVRKRERLDVGATLAVTPDEIHNGLSRRDACGTRITRI
jgi:hypothetical protein